MKFFETLAESLSGGLTATLIIKPTANGRMTVCANFTTASGAVSDTLAPFTLKGTPQEMDEGFLEAIAQPIETVKGLVSNLEAFKKSAEKATKDAQKTVTKTPTSTNDAIKKAEEERKKREAEAKAKKENFEKAKAAAKDANAHGNYYLAEALMNLASTLTDDKKMKADISKQLKALEPQKDGFLCNDDAESAAKALEEFKNSMVKPEVPSSKAEAAPAEPKGDAQEPVDIEIPEADAEEIEVETENDEENEAA